MRKVAICTLGCKVNQYESEEIMRGFMARGCERVDFSQRADIYIVNTCTVTSLSDHKSRQMIRRAIRTNPQAVVAVTGCYAESSGNYIATIDGVDFVVGNREKLGLSRMILGDSGEDIPIPSPSRLRTRALIKIQDGCDQFCSFCQIPYVRGGLSSRPLPEIVSEAKRLTEGGTQEIVLTGIHLGKYGADCGNKYGLTYVLESLINLAGLSRIRLSSIEIGEVTEDLVGLIASSGKICRHLHVPLQSGSNEVLRRMNRNYTAEEYLAVIRNIRKQIPDIAITTDVMVGFPGESEEQFGQSLKLAENIGFAKIHVFNFSARPSTPAAGMNAQIPAGIRSRRSKAMLELNRLLMQQYRQRFLGRILDVLVESKKGEYVVGLSDNYLRVGFFGSQDLIGRLVEVELSEIGEDLILGRAISKEEICDLRR